MFPAGQMAGLRCFVSLTLLTEQPVRAGVRPYFGAEETEAPRCPAGVRAPPVCSDSEINVPSIGAQTPGLGGCDN